MPVTENDLAVDRELAEISGLVPLLRFATPVNTTEQYRRFVEHGAEPEFEYLQPPDLIEIAERLSRVDPNRAEDPQIGVIASRKKRELEVIIEMLTMRGTEAFLNAAIDLFGHVEQNLVEVASRILSNRPARTRDGGNVTPLGFARIARAEIARYRERHPELKAKVTVSDQVAGIRVENGDLFIGADVRIPTGRVEALLQHEVGVHVLTYANGSAQPLKLLAAGLPGYDENQEALGVMAEHLSGGLSPSRLQVLALRVIASHTRTAQATFTETVTELQRLGASLRVAFITAMRSHRAGGMTRDAGYLRGIVRLIDHLHRGGNLETLLIGKVGLEDAPVIEDLLQRGVLAEAPLRPRFLDTDEGRQSYQKIQLGENFIERMAS